MKGAAQSDYPTENYHKLCSTTELFKHLIAPSFGPVSVLSSALFPDVASSCFESC